MYFPILRGRQFELIALRECLEAKKLSEKIIPIIEPVKLSVTYIKTVEKFIAQNHKIAIIVNPQIGTYERELDREENPEIKEKLYAFLKHPTVIPALYAEPDMLKVMKEMEKYGIQSEKSLFIIKDKDCIEPFKEHIGDTKTLYNVIPGDRKFNAKIKGNRILWEDPFNKKNRNADCSDKDEPFSEEHLYYKDDGFVGFSDYSVIGEEYTDSVFAPRAVAIHIVYFNEDKEVRVIHFVSDSNNCIEDPAGKFAEAARKMVEWNEKYKLSTQGILELENKYHEQIYPGLGVVKKCSLMHHFELMSMFLNGENV